MHLKRKCLGLLQLFIALQQHLFAFFDSYYDTIYRANFHALGFFIMSFALSAFFRYDVVEVFRQWWMSFSTQLPFSSPFIDSGVGAFRFTCTTVDAFIGNLERHATS